MKPKHILSCLAVVLVSASSAFSQPTSLPVYQITQSGATYLQASSLAAALNVPVTEMLVTNGEAFFISSNFLQIPSTPITDAVTISNLLAVTTNYYPAIPISLQQVDFTTLNNMPVLGTNKAMAIFSNALINAQLNPNAYGAGVTGTPISSHTVFYGYYTNGGTVVTGSNALDTEIRYQLIDTNGYAFIGPGAEAQIAFDGNSNVTRLYYTAPRFTTGPSVQIISSNEASNRAAALLDPTGLGRLTVAPTLVYFVPPGVTNFVIPWYQCSASSITTDPTTGMTNGMSLIGVSIPATDDTNFVPSLNLTASFDPSTGQVVANAAVTGGTPPYTYSWGGGMDSGVFSNTSASASFTPQVRIAPPTLQIFPVSGSALVSWIDPDPNPWMLESANTLSSSSNSWTTVTNAVQTNGATYTVTVPINNAGATFFRLASAATTVTYNAPVTVTVTDSSGIQVQAMTMVVLDAQIISSPAADPPGIFYGAENPYAVCSPEANSWLNAMGNPLAGGGGLRFHWTDIQCQPGDYIEPPVPETLPASPEIFGQADYENWGVNTANIVFHAGHGYPTAIPFSYPNFTNYLYNGAGSWLFAPGMEPAVWIWPLCANGWSTYRVNWVHSWGGLASPNDRLNWLCFFACLQFLYDYDFPHPGGTYFSDTPDVRWGPAFNGLHLMLGFYSAAQGSGGRFGQIFANDYLGVGTPNNKPLTIISAWVDARLRSEQKGIRNGALGPFSLNGGNDWADYYWGKGSVGPTIPVYQIGGWGYLISPSL